MDRFNEMSNLVVKFLCKHGNLPVIKNVDPRILDAERRLSNKLIRLQAGVEGEFIRALRRRGYLPSNIVDQRALLSEVFGIPFDNMKTVIADESITASEVGRQLTLDDFAREGIQFVGDRLKDQTREIIWNRVYQFSEDTFSRIEGDFIQTLANGYDQGMGIDEVATNLRGDFKDLRDNRLNTIARTEIQSAQNEGTEETMKEYGVNYKQWLSVGDDRVRGNHSNDEYDHVYMHGQVVKMDEPFSNGLMYPTDRSGDIGNWINCRCRQRPYIPKRGEVILATPYYPIGA